MILRVFKPSLRDAAGQTSNYIDYDCESWEVHNGVLSIDQGDERQHLPLVNIESFKELE